MRFPNNAYGSTVPRPTQVMMLPGEVLTYPVGEDKETQFPHRDQDLHYLKQLGFQRDREQ